MHEFTYLGDATVARPDRSGPDSDRAFFEYAYLRANPAGPHEELWYHAQGCRSWIKVARDTTSHSIQGASLMRGHAR